MVCPFCNSEQGDDVIFCSACGGKIKEQGNNFQQNPFPNYQQAQYQQYQQHQQYQQYQPYQQNPNYQYDPELNKANSFAKTSLICGIISLFCFGFILGTLAIVFGALSFAKLSKANQPKGTAVAGLVLGIIGVIGWIFVMIYWSALMSLI